MSMGFFQTEEWYVAENCAIVHRIGLLAGPAVGSGLTSHFPRRLSQSDPGSSDLGCGRLEIGKNPVRA